MIPAERLEIPAEAELRVFRLQIGDELLRVHRHIGIRRKAEVVDVDLATELLVLGISHGSLELPSRRQLVREIRHGLDVIDSIGVDVGPTVKRLSAELRGKPEISVLIRGHVESLVADGLHALPESEQIDSHSLPDVETHRRRCGVALVSLPPLDGVLFLHRARQAVANASAFRERPGNVELAPQEIV